MNQMEAFKWEQKRQAASVKDRDKEKVAKDREAEDRRAQEKAEADDRLREQVRREDAKREKELDELEKLVVQQAQLAGRSPELTSLPKDLPTIEIVTVTATSSQTSTPSASSVSTSSRTSSSEQSVSVESIYVPSRESFTNATEPASSASVSSSKQPSTRSDSSESIYAHIIRRLNALEGNSSLVARYIEEQAKVMRTMLGRVERGWDDWRYEREAEERGRWEQEVMEIPTVPEGHTDGSANAPGGPTRASHLTDGATASHTRPRAQNDPVRDTNLI